MTEPPNDDEPPIAWTAIQQHEDVLDANEEKLGTIEEVLGTGETGVFHGIVVRTSLLGHPVSVPASSVGRITSRSVCLTIDKNAFTELPPYQEEKSFSLGIKGVFRHRPGWVAEE